MRLPPEPVPDTGHGEVLPRSPVVRTGRHLQEAHVARPDLPGHARAVENPLRLAAVEADAAREERAGVAGREREEVEAVEEELAAFLEEQGETREVHLPLVDLGLGKVGVDGEVDLERRREVVEQISAAGAFPRVTRLVAARGTAGRGQRIRADVEANTLRDITQAHDAAGVGHAVEPLVPPPAGPVAFLVDAPDGALEVGAPGIVRRIEVDGPEGNLDLGHPALVGLPHAGNPDAVPRLVHAAVDIGDEAVAHGTRGIDLEEVAAAAIEIRVERPHEPVVAGEGLVALHLVAQQQVGFGIEARDAHDQPVAVEHDAHLGAFGRRGAVERIALQEVGGHRSRLPEGFVEQAVDGDAGLVGQAHGRNLRTRAVGRRGRWYRLRGHQGGGHQQEAGPDRRERSCRHKKPEYTGSGARFG